jgi:hypothetical protein
MKNNMSKKDEVRGLYINKDGEKVCMYTSEWKQYLADNPEFAAQLERESAERASRPAGKSIHQEIEEQNERKRQIELWSNKK